MSNNATKTDLKNTPWIYTLKLAYKVDLASLKSNVDKLDIDELVTVPVDLIKLSNVVKKNVLKKTEYNELVKIVAAILTKGLTKKAMNGYKILNVARYFSPETFQNRLICFSYKNILDFLLTHLKFHYRNLCDFQKKALKIYVNQTSVLLQLYLIFIHYQILNLMDTAE